MGSGPSVSNSPFRASSQAVAAAEDMAKVRVESVLLSVSAGRLQGQLIEAAADIKGGAVTSADVSRVTSAGMHHATGEGRTVLHALPVGYALDGVKGIRDPKGMVARQMQEFKKLQAARSEKAAVLTDEGRD